MRPCTNCIRTGERCVADRAHDKCANCVKNTKTSCDLVVSQEDWDKLDDERTRLSELLKRQRARRAAAVVAAAAAAKEMVDADRESSRIEKLQKLLSERASQMIAREIANIEELEADEHREASTAASEPVSLP